GSAGRKPGWTLRSFRWWGCSVILAMLPFNADGEVRQPVNGCFSGRVIGGTLTTSEEASEAAWVAPAALDGYDIHPSILRRIVHGLEPGHAPHVDWPGPGAPGCSLVGSRVRVHARPRPGRREQGPGSESSWYGCFG
ncbi:MAG TPA: hypothetical protein VIV12_12225, partial [Streptosporangiaceae bacterium]